ncbi:MAG: PKD domain-containing protein [Vallitaleaceae bacterium]|nr:PKD domain-containing protein [Vallitaleaceae bacterium]
MKSIIKMRRHISRLILLLLFVQSSALPSYGWEQNTHEEINRTSVDRFSNQYETSKKYKYNFVNFDKAISAPNVTSSGKFERTYLQQWFLKPARDHVVHGGFSADEPHIYVSVKHFYDPLALSGSHQLTDQYALHGWHIYEAIPANDWALYKDENPYSLINAMRNYKRALEIPCDASVSSMPMTADFRDFAGTPTDLQEMRSMYTGKAMRGLGEVMHLVADMTQPAHVRNDAHPKYEITETAVKNRILSRNITKMPRLDGLLLDDYGSTINQLMVGLATWTNQNFYSEDTLADTQLEVKPRNGEIPYSSPQLSNMDKKVTDKFYTWYQTFGDVEVPMVRLESGYVYDSYVITADFATQQAFVLIPLAVAATTRTMNLFFPTLDMKQMITEVEPDDDILEEALKKGAEELKQFTYDATLSHLVENDPEWRVVDFKINYAGPGEIWTVKGNKHEKLCDVEFKDGKIVRYPDPLTGEMIDGTPTFWMPLGTDKKISLGGSFIDYTIEMDDALYAVAHAGVQIVNSEHYVFEQNAPTITLEADRTTIMPGEAVTFKVEIENAPERYKLEWTFGDEEDDEENILPPVITRDKEMTHIYEKEKEYLARIKIIDTKRNLERASDSINISSYMGEMAGPWDVVLTIEEESQVLRTMIIALMKVIINVFIIPIAEAFGEDPGNMDSQIETFTFVGTTMTYALELRRIEESEVLYEGPFTFVESNTGYIEGADDIVGLRMEIKKGAVVMIALAYTEDGTYVEYEFLKNGKMVGPGEIVGDYDLTGFMSGSWRATKK